MRLSKSQSPWVALSWLVQENYYQFKYKISTPYLGENLNSTIMLAAEKDAYENMPGSYFLFHTGLKKINLEPKLISFLDVGCGTGRFVSVAIQHTFLFSRGIDLDSAGLRIAAQNAVISGRRAGDQNSYEIINCDASLYDIPGDVNVIYFFNPFGEKTMQHVVSNITKSYALKPRNIYVIYIIPVFEALFLRTGFKLIYSLSHKNQKSLSVLKLPDTGVLA